MTMLSIIIPVYNQAPYLSECLESVLSQRFSDFEIIAVDDGSTDTSPAILEQYARNDCRVKIISKENGGYGSAMNTGLLNTHGAYIGIIEPDDTILPQMYEELIGKAEQTNADIVKCSFQKVLSCGLRLEETSRDNFAGKLFKLEDMPGICRLHPAIWAAVYKRELIEQNNITFSETPAASSQDVPFFADAYSAAESIYIIPKALYNYRIKSANKFASTSEIDEKIFYRFENYRKAEEIYRKRGIWHRVKYPELQSEFIMLNNCALRIDNRLRRRLYNEIHRYFTDISADEAHKFLPRNFCRSFRLIKKGGYNKWLLQYALVYIMIIRILKIFSLTDLLRWVYLKRAGSIKSPV